MRQQVLRTLVKLYNTPDESEDGMGRPVEAYLADERPAVQSGTSVHCPDLSEAIQHLTLQQSRDALLKIFAKQPQEARTSFLEEVCEKHLTKKALLSLALELLWLTNRDSRVAAGNAIYMNLATEIGINTNPVDFVPLSLEAMRRLKHKGKPNLVYDFCACLGKDRPGTKQP